MYQETDTLQMEIKGLAAGQEHLGRLSNDIDSNLSLVIEDVLKVVNDMSARIYYAGNEERNMLLEERENGLKEVNEYLRGRLMGEQDILKALGDERTGARAESTTQRENLLTRIAQITQIEDLQRQLNRLEAADKILKQVIALSNTAHISQGHPTATQPPRTSLSLTEEAANPKISQARDRVPERTFDLLAEATGKPPRKGLSQSRQLRFTSFFSIKSLKTQFKGRFGMANRYRLNVERVAERLSYCGGVGGLFQY